MPSGGTNDAAARIRIHPVPAAQAESQVRGGRRLAGTIPTPSCTVCRPAHVCSPLRTPPCDRTTGGLAHRPVGFSHVPHSVDPSPGETAQRPETGSSGSWLVRSRSEPSASRPCVAQPTFCVSSTTKQPGPIRRPIHDVDRRTRDIISTNRPDDCPTSCEISDLYCAPRRIDGSLPPPRTVSTDGSHQGAIDLDINRTSCTRT